MAVLSFSVLLSLALSLLAAGTLAADYVLVKTPLGTTRGTVDQGFYYFQGLPYGEPPVGSLRWEPPVPKATWGPDIFNATSKGVCCMSPDHGGDRVSEDCLILNIFVPQNASFGGPSSKLLPVIIWIHGGSFTSGCSHDRSTLGNFLANTTNTLFVTINYRLGALGTFVNDKVGGNFGLMDQILAMQWVQSYISYFGGDPNRVTIAGGSAGAMSVAMHLTSPISVANNLFQGAIIESNPIALQSTSVDQAKSNAESLGSYLGCAKDDIDCYRSKSAQKIMDAQTKVAPIPWPPKLTTMILPWMPYIDGHIVPDTTLRRLSEGKYHRVPVLLGTTKDETLTFAKDATSPFHNQIFSLAYEAVVVLLFGLDSIKVFQHYPASSHKGDDFDTMVRLTTDFLFMCPNRNAAITLSSAGLPVYHYWFTRSIPPNLVPIVPSYCSTGAACHGTEAEYVFNSPAFYGHWFPPEDWQLSTTMRQYWGAFAHNQTGKNTTVNSLWTPFTKSNLETMNFNIPVGNMSHAINANNCDMWDSLGYNF